MAGWDIIVKECATPELYFTKLLGGALATFSPTVFECWLYVTIKFFRIIKRKTIGIVCFLYNTKFVYWASPM